MKKILPVGLLLIASAFWTPSAFATEYLSYCRIDARLKLDERNRPSIIEGHELLTWHNGSPDTITELQFHLYLNAFKNEKSTFFRESGGRLRGDRFEPGEWGWIDIVKMQIPGGEDLTSRIEFIHPDDDNADDQTVIRVPLPAPLKPGNAVTVDIEFNSRLPRVFARTGYWNSFAMVAQWFPKIGVWETAGVRRRAKAGWNCHQFHANSEFYADYFPFDVTLTVPAVYKDKIGATGALKSERANEDGAITYNYFQDRVHDFAWTVDTNFIKVVREFRAEEWVTPQEIVELSRKLSVPFEDLSLGNVSVTLLIQPEHVSQTDRHFRATFEAIKHFGLWYGAYPYQTLTVVDPPYNAEGAGGMEYPTLITAGTRWWAGRDQNPEEVIIHEFGHQYWYGLVATNEFEEAWLDEGFNTYSTARILGKIYGGSVLPFTFWSVPWFYFPVEIPRPYENRILTLQGPFLDSLRTPSWKHYDSTSYGLNSYPRTGLVLSTLEGWLGEDVFARVMRTYHQKWRFGHPTAEDFFDVANEVSGQNLTWFFAQFVNGTATLDYELAAAKSTPQKQAAGVFDSNGQRTEVKAEQNSGAGSESERYLTDVDVRRLGDAWFPVEIRIVLKNGKAISISPSAFGEGGIEYRIENGEDESVTTDFWAYEDRWKRFRFSTAAEVHSAAVDPKRKVLLDANMTNNSRAETTGARGAMRWSSGAMFWVQTFLHALSFFS